MARDHLGSDRLSEVFGAPLSRRRLLRLSAGVLGAGAFGSLLAACGGDDDDSTETSGSTSATATTGGTATGGGAPSSGATATSGGTASGGTASPAATTSQPSSGAGVKGGTLRVAIIGEPPAFDPTFTTATITQNTTWHVFEGLFAPDEQFTPQPMLLESHEVTDDGKIFTFHLRQNVPFHNGNTMNADDVIASLDRYSKLSGRGRTLFERLDNMERVDDFTVKLNFSEPTGIAPVYLQMADAIVIPKDIAEASPDKEMTEFIGTGPFMMKERLPDRYTSLVRFEDYAKLDKEPDGYGGGKTAWFDEIRFIPVPEQAVRSDGLITDEYDYSESLSTDQYDGLKDEPDLGLQVALPYYFYGAHFNKAEGNIMSNHDLRMALLTAVDMDPPARAGFGPEQFWRLGPEMSAPETAWYTDAGKEFYDIGDPEKAKQMLQDAGYDGTPIRWITTKEYSYNYNMAVVLKDQMEAAGATIDLQLMDWATLVATRSQRDSWDIFITGHPSYNHPVLQVFLNETWPGFWGNADKDKDVTGIIEEPDPTKQMDFIVDLQKVWWEDAAMVKVCEGATFRAYRKRLKGYADLPDWFFWNAWFEE